MSNFINAQDWFVLQEIHGSTDEGRVRDRIKAVLLLDKDWIKKGEIKEIKSNAGRDRVNVNGALDIENLDFRFTSGKSINAQSIIKFFRKLERANPLARSGQIGQRLC